VALTINSKMGELLANPKGKAVLERHMPGISLNPQMAMAKGMSLKMLAPLSGGKITVAMLKAVDEDLQKL